MIDLHNVKKRYRDFQLDVSLSVPDNSITGIIGLNGSGKSTTFKILMDLVQKESGSVQVFGKDVDSLSAADKEKIGVTWADSGFYELFTPRQVKKILAGFYKKFDEDYYAKMLKEFDIEETKTIKSLSTGMKAKFKIVCALSHHPSLLVLDEPTSGCDVLARDKILDLLREFMMEEGHSIIISSHISSDLESLCDDFYFIDNGKIIMHETIDALNTDYGLLHVENPDTFDPIYCIKKIKTPYGWDYLTNQRQYYLDNYPAAMSDTSNIDNLMKIMIEGESL